MSRLLRAGASAARAVARAWRALAFAMAFAGCAGAAGAAVPAAGTAVPLHDFGGRPVVDVFIEGKGPYRFIVDTGADETVIDTSLAQELDAGSSRPVELRVGDAVVRGLRVHPMPLSAMLRAPDAPRGVLSASAFPGTLVTFDFPARRLVLQPGALAEDGAAQLFTYDPSDLPSLPLDVAGRRIVVHLDTGAPHAVSLPTRYMAGLPLAGKPVQTGIARTPAGTAPMFAARLEGAVALGSFTLAGHELHFSDVVPDPAATPKGQLGAAALRDFVVTLDSANHRIRVERAATRE